MYWWLLMGFFRHCSHHLHSRKKNNNLLGLSCSVPTWTPETTYQNPPPNWRLADPIRIIVGSKTHCIQNFCWMEPKMRHRKYLPSHQWSPKAQELDVSGRSSNFCCLSASAPSLFVGCHWGVWKCLESHLPMESHAFLTWVDLPMAVGEQKSWVSHKLGKLCKATKCPLRVRIWQVRIGEQTVQM